MQPTTMLPELSETTQTISFAEDDDTCGVELYSSNVVVTTNPGKHTHGSSKIKLKNLVDYSWQAKYYPGNLIALHISGKYYAYSIVAPSSADSGATKTNSIVRVVYLPEPCVELRALIRGLKGEVNRSKSLAKYWGQPPLNFKVQDIAFAHIKNQVVLACIDELGNFYIHEIQANSTGISIRLTAEVREDTGAGGCNHRVVWCPYIPDPDEEDEVPDEDAARLLLTTHANQARMWNVRAVEMSCAGAGWVSASEAMRAGAGRGAGTHGGAVTAAAFSPDGTALATVAADGYVMFAQVYTNNETSTHCLHKWQPHDGKPLSCLFFLDNHKNFTSEILYVLSMGRDSDDSTAYCKSISQFLLRYPILSFCVIDAEEIKSKCESSCNDPFYSNGSGGEAGDSSDDYEINDEDGDGSVSGGGARVRVRLFIIDPKSLQEATLVYEPPAPGTPPDRMLPMHDMEELTLEDDAEDASSEAVQSTIIQQQTQQLKNLLMRSQTQPGSLMGPRPESPSSLPPPLNLMTPDAFSSPGKREDDDPPLSATPDISNKSILSAGLNEEAPLCAENKASGGSSPSREVQEIMGHNDLFTDMEEEEEAAKQIASQEEPSVAPTTDALVPTGQLLSADLFTSPEKPPPPAKLTHANSDTSWPQISIAQITEANQRKASSEKSSTQSLNAPLNAPLVPLPAPNAPPPASDVPSAPDVRYVTDEDTKQRLNALEDKIDNITELLSAQQRLLSSLRGELHAPRALLEESAQRTAAAVDAALTGGWDRVARMAEAASTAAATAAGAGAARKLEPLAHALQHELASKLSATDRLLRDNIDKLANSKTIMERLSTAIAQSLSDMVQESFREALCKSVVPVMEKALTQIFRQINQAFQNGTKEFTANTEAAARAAAERGGAAAAASLRTALERHAEALTQAAPLQPQLFAAQIQEVVHGVLEKEVSWWREQTRSAVQMSRAHSPAHSAASATDRKMQVSQIQSLIASGDINGAFQYALSASDLALVVAACCAAEPARVFGPPCRLKQHVLLSLVQQLAADMANDTLLKQRYLEEAVMNLDTSNPVTREHLPGVIRELKKQITAFLSQHPSHALTRQFRMLLMATEALVKTPA